MKAHPNLVFIVPDEFRPYSMAFLGREPVVTPNLDRFAGQSTTFTNMVSNFPVCSPYRGMLFSGRYPYKNGVVGNCNSRNSAVTLPEDFSILPDLLAAEGYCMGYIGKWHLQAPRPGDEVYGEGPRDDGVVWDTFTPPGKGRHGFDFWYSHGCCDNHNHPHYWTGDAGIGSAIHVDEWSTIHETNVAIDYLKNSSDQRDPEKPFALFVAFNPPHMPFNQVPEVYQDIYRDKKPEDLAVWENLAPDGMDLIRDDISNYFSMISGVDHQFGRLLDTLNEQALAEDTIVVFTSDHGDMMGSHGQVRKGQWYNESLLVPFIVRNPGGTRPGALDDALLCTVDIYPTLLGMLGLAASIPGDLDGVDCSARINDGKSETRDAAFYMRIDHLNCTTGSRGVKTPRYTFAVEKHETGAEYFLVDNIADPEQFKNIYGEDTTLDQRLRIRLDEFLRQAEDPFAGWDG